MKTTNWRRTDLIDETDEVVVHKTKEQKETLEHTDGVVFKEKQFKRVKITKVTVDEDGAREVQKAKGEYITLSVPTLTIEDEQGFQQLEKTVIESLDDLHEALSLKSSDTILIIGLGNKTITPDAVGPLTIDALQKENSEQESNFILFAPGVTGQTGYETSDFVAALAEKIKPKLIIVIDALATRSTERLCKTIQLTNTGIHPGSGVGNERKEISETSLGIPVTAIGIPTVVGGPVLVSDAIDRVFKSIATRIQEKKSPSSKLSVTSNITIDENVDVSVTQSIFGEWVNWPKEEREQLLHEVLSSSVERLIVTPKEIDIWTVQYSILLTNSLFKWGKKIQHK